MEIEIAVIPADIAPLAVPKDFQNQAEARQGGEAEPTRSPVVPSEDR